MDLISAFLVILAAYVSGIINATVGSGNLILIPALTLLGMPIQLALGTARIPVIMDSFTSFMGYRREGKVDLDGALPLFVVLGCGGFFGSLIASSVPSDTIRSLFAIFIVLMGLALFIKTEERQKKINRFALTGGFLAIGFLVGIFGAGLGTVSILFLSFSGYRLLTAVGTSQAMIVAANVFAFMGFIYMGFVDFGVGITVGIFASLGAYTGVKIATKVDEKWLKRALLLVVLVFAIRLF